MPSRTQTAAQWLEAREARLNPPMDDSEDMVDPFADLPDGDEAQVAKLRVMFDWTPPRQLMH